MATTVSPTYAQEISGNPAIAPHHAKFFGIRNGIDPDIWDPAEDAHLPRWVLCCSTGKLLPCAPPTPRVEPTARQSPLPTATLAPPPLRTHTTHLPTHPACVFS